MDDRVKALSGGNMDIDLASEGRILLQKRTDNHCWGYAGCAVELDEKVEIEQIVFAA